PSAESRPLIPGGSHARAAGPQPHQGAPPRPRRRPGAARVELPHAPGAAAGGPAGAVRPGGLRAEPAGLRIARRPAEADRRPPAAGPGTGTGGGGRGAGRQRGGGAGAAVEHRPAGRAGAGAGAAARAAAGAGAGGLGGVAGGVAGGGGGGAGGAEAGAVVRQHPGAVPAAGDVPGREAPGRAAPALPGRGPPSQAPPLLSRLYARSICRLLEPFLPLPFSARDRRQAGPAGGVPVGSYVTLTLPVAP